MSVGAWRMGVGVVGAAALVAAAPTPSAEPVRAIASDTNSGARIVLSWPERQDRPAPDVVASVEGEALVVRSETPMAMDLERLKAEAPASVRDAALSPDGKTLRVALRRPMRASLEALPGGHAVMLAWETPAAADGARVTVAETPEFTRLTFRFDQPVTLTPLLQGDRLDLRFSRPAELDLSPLSVAPPRFVRSARIASNPGQRLSVSLNLAPGTRQRHFVEGAQAVVDLLAPRPADAGGAPKPVVAAAPAADPAPPGGVVPLQVSEAGAATTFTLRWAGPARAAAFRRGEALWLVFETNARISLDGVPRVGRRHTDLSVVRGEGVVGVRIAAPPAAQLSAQTNGAVWTFTLADRLMQPPETRIAPARAQAAAGVALTVPFGREGVVRWLEDPIVGDRFAVGLLPAPVLGVAERRATLEAALLPTAHGALAEVRADGVGAVFEGGSFSVSRGQGLIASSAVRRGAAADQTDLDAEAATAFAGDAMLNFAEWSKTSEKTPREMLDELQRRAAMEGTDIGAPTNARIALARFLLATDFAPEALGALRLAAVNQPQLEVDPEFRLMRAAASLMMGRLADAQKDLSASGLAEDPSAALWRGYAAAQAENWSEARRNFELGRSALPAQPPSWRTRMFAAAAESALRLQDIPSAEVDAAAALATANSAPLRAHAQGLIARIARAKGDTARALRLFDELSRSRDEATAVRAMLESVRLRRELNQITPAAAVEALDALRFRWRGDALELETIQTLAFVYADMGRWREGLTIMRQAAMRFDQHPAARRMRMDMAALFERLYLEGGADALDPIQALGLFYDFKDLTPYGPDGDRMVRLLAGRLASMDLMEQAAELLQHQVSERLEGVGQAQIAADLAALYLADNRPEQAIAALQATRQPRLPAELVAERRILEATSLLRLGRFDHALELLEKDQSPDGQRVRAEVAWRQKDWPNAARALERVLAVRRPPDGPLTPEDRDVVLRLAVAQVFADDRAGLAATRRRYAALMEGSPEADTFEVVTESPDSGGDIAGAVRRLARTDLLDRFMARMRQRVAPAPDAAAAPPA